MSSATIPVFDKSDPKTSNVTAFHLPPTPEWSPLSDNVSSMGMAVAGGGMFLKNPMMVWASIFLTAMAIVNDQPLRQKEGATSLLSGLAMAGAGLLSTVLPRMIITPPTQIAGTRGGGPLEG